MEFNEVVKNRYSCKKFSADPVPEEKLNGILEAGRCALTAKNLQEYHVYVIRSAEGLALVDQSTPCRYGARTVLLVTCYKDDAFVYPGGKYDSAVEDAAIVAAHLALAAYNEGVDGCWVNFFDPDKVRECFSLRGDEFPLMFLDLGYAAEGAGPLPNHFSRKPLEETVSYI